MTVLCLCAAAGSAQPEIDTTKFDMHAFIQLNAVGIDLAGKPFESDVFIYRGGPTFLAYTAVTGDARKVNRGIASTGQLKNLDRALTAARVDLRRDKCGGPAADGVRQYALTWFSAKGRAINTIHIGGNYTSCPAKVRQIFDATCEFITSVLGPSPEVCVPPPSR
jgi:hypothetical protein